MAKNIYLILGSIYGILIVIFPISPLDVITSSRRLNMPKVSNMKVKMRKLYALILEHFESLFYNISQSNTNPDEVLPNRFNRELIDMVKLQDIKQLKMSLSMKLNVILAI